MKRVYIAGAYSASNISTILRNIKKGQRLAKDVLLWGFAVFCPFLDYQLFFHLEGGEDISEKMIRDHGLAWLGVSDAVLLVPGWEYSIGIQAEIARAKELGIPIFTDPMRMFFVLTSNIREQTQ